MTKEQKDMLYVSIILLGIVFFVAALAYGLGQVNGLHVASEHSKELAALLDGHSVARVTRDLCGNADRWVGIPAFLAIVLGMYGYIRNNNEL